MKTFRFVILALLLSNSLHAQLRYENINGVISFDERRDTTKSRIHRTENENVLLRSDKDFIYVGVHSETLASVSIILTKSDEVIVFHLSGCTGRGIYKKGKDDSLRIVNPFYDVREKPEKWDVVGQFASRVALKKEKSMETVRTEMVSCQNKNGYMGSMLDMGSYRDAEILFSKKVFKEYRMLVQNTEYLPNDRIRATKYFYPADGISGDPVAIQKLLDGTEKTTVKIQFDTEKWIQLSTL